MSFPHYPMDCAGIPKEKNPGWESIRSGAGLVGQSEEMRVIAAGIGKKKGRWESRVFDRRAARAKAQSSPPCSFYLAVERAGWSAKKHGLTRNSDEQTLWSVVKILMFKVPPNRTVKVYLGLGSALLMGACIFLVLFVRLPSEPKYQGRVLNEWLRRTRPSSGDYDEGAKAAAAFAVEMMGTESALPQFRAYLKVGSFPERMLFKALPISVQRRFCGDRLWSLYWRKDVTLDLLESLRNEAVSAVPELVRMAKDKSEFQYLRLRALSVLVVVSDNPAVEREIEPLTRDSDFQVGNQATRVVRAFRRIKENREQSRIAQLIERKGSTQDSRSTLLEPLWKSTDGLIPEKEK
jgi:hypothetical protein